MRNLCKILLAKIIKKSVSEAMEPMPENGVGPEVIPNRDFWRFVIQTLISILTAVLTALGATSCVNHLV